MERLQLDLIGCGGMAGAHVRGLEELWKAGIRDIQVVACCDLVEEQAQQRAHERALREAAAALEQAQSAHAERLSEAEAALSKAWELGDTTLPAWELGKMLDDLAGVRDMQGRLDEAMTLYKKALEVRRNARGPTHPDVAEVAVVGTPDEERGQLVTAFVVLRDGHHGDDSVGPPSLRRLQHAGR